MTIAITQAQKDAWKAQIRAMRPAMALFRQSGTVRTLSGSVTRAEFQAAIDIGPGTIECYNVTCLADGTELAPVSGLSVLDMTGDSVVRANAATSQQLVDGTVNDCKSMVWGVSLDGQNIVSTSLLFLPAQNNKVVLCSITGTNADTNSGVSVRGGGGKASVIGCDFSALGQAIAAGTVVEAGTVATFDLNVMENMLRRNIYCVANDVAWTYVHTRNYHGPHPDTVPVFQHFAAQVTGTGQFVDIVEYGNILVGNGLAYSKSRADALEAPNGVADQISGHNIEGGVRKFNACVDGGEAALVASRSSHDVLHEDNIVINLDTCVGAGSVNDDPLDETQPDSELLNSNLTYRRTLVLSSALDREDDHGGTAPEYLNGACQGLNGSDVNGLTIDGLTVIGAAGGKLKRAVLGRRVNNYTESGVVSLNQTLVGATDIAGY